jgi:protein-S-isoprenylcysteine O-methyltransferase Ste14
MIRLLVYLIFASLLVIGAFVIFRIFVRRDYQQKGQLTPFSSFLELLICTCYIAIPYIYNPPCWAIIWSCQSPVSPALRIIGLISVVAGAAIAFPAMIWLGIRRSFGQESNVLKQTGFYRFTRNPQIIGGALMVIGVAVLWPSWYALGWVILAAVFHLMVITEEENLQNGYGEEYMQYCKRVPRYIGLPHKKYMP